MKRIIFGPKFIPVRVHVHLFSFGFKSIVKIKDRDGFIQAKNSLTAAKNDYRRCHWKANIMINEIKCLKNLPHFSALLSKIQITGLL